MKISVITPTLNSEKTITKNVKSILTQSYKDFEHIIIDSLSNDKTLKTIKNLYRDSPSNLSIISEKDNGIAEAFNKGINISTGDIITILNSDDYYYSENIFEAVIDSFKKPGQLIFHGDVLFIDQKYGSYLRTPYSLNELTTMPLNHPTMFVRKEIYSNVGLFDTSYRYVMDFEFYCRLFKSIPELANRIFYFDKNPITVMSAGGESWNYEIESIYEIKRALKQHKLLNSKLSIKLWIRLLRANLKNIFDKVGLTLLVKFWRKMKHQKPLTNN